MPLACERMTALKKEALSQKVERIGPVLKKMVYICWDHQYCDVWWHLTIWQKNLSQMKDHISDNFLNGKTPSLEKPTLNLTHEEKFFSRDNKMGLISLAGVVLETIDSI